MEGKLDVLPDDVKSKIRSGFNISSISRAIVELVLNSLDANSTSIAVRFDLRKIRVQVVDNGNGLSKANLQQLGPRYMTTKCHSLRELNSQLKYFGYRGESLPSIIEISEIVSVETRDRASQETWKREFVKGKGGKVVASVPFRPSAGTTITVHNMMYCLPVRRNKIKPTLEIEEIKYQLLTVALIHPGASFTLRNDDGNKVILSTPKTGNIASVFHHVYPEERKVQFSLYKYGFECVRVHGCFGTTLSNNKQLQFVYVNNRFVKCCRIHKVVNGLLNTSFLVKDERILRQKLIEKGAKQGHFLQFSPPRNQDKFPIFIVNIKCPLTFYDINFNPEKDMVEFTDWDVVLECVEQTVKGFLQKEAKKRLGNESVNRSDGIERKCVRKKRPAETVSTEDGSVVCEMDKTRKKPNNKIDAKSVKTLRKSVRNNSRDETNESDRQITSLDTSYTASTNLKRKLTRDDIDNIENPYVDFAKIRKKNEEKDSRMSPVKYPNLSEVTPKNTNDESIFKIPKLPRRLTVTRRRSILIKQYKNYNNRFQGQTIKSQRQVQSKLLSATSANHIIENLHRKIYKLLMKHNNNIRYSQVVREYLYSKQSVQSYSQFHYNKIYDDFMSEHFGHSWLIEQSTATSVNYICKSCNYKITTCLDNGRVIPLKECAYGGQENEHQRVGKDDRLLVNRRLQEQAREKALRDKQNFTALVDCETHATSVRATDGSEAEPEVSIGNNFEPVLDQYYHHISKEMFNASMNTLNIKAVDDNYEVSGNAVDFQREIQDVVEPNHPCNVDISATVVTDSDPLFSIHKLNGNVENVPRLNISFNEAFFKNDIFQNDFHIEQQGIFDDVDRRKEDGIDLQDSEFQIFPTPCNFNPNMTPNASFQLFDVNEELMSNPELKMTDISEPKKKSDEIQTPKINRGDIYNSNGNMTPNITFQLFDGNEELVSNPNTRTYICEPKKKVDINVETSSPYFNSQRNNVDNTFLNLSISEINIPDKSVDDHLRYNRRSNMLDNNSTQVLESGYQGNKLDNLEKSMDVSNVGFNENVDLEERPRLCFDFMSGVINKFMDNKTEFGKSTELVPGSVQCVHEENELKIDNAVLKVDVVSNIPVDKRDRECVKVNEETGVIMNSSIGEWVEQTDSNGQLFYVNMQNGVSSLTVPMKSGVFEIANRLHFLPKGMSPIFNSRHSVPLVKLSPRSKDAIKAILDEKVLKINDTNFTKWEDATGKVSKGTEEFVNDVIQLTRNKMEFCEPKIFDLYNGRSGNIKTSRVLQKCTLDSDIFSGMEVVGQLDKKFIIAVATDGVKETKRSEHTRMLVLFDQHAVHERIRVEEILKAYELGSQEIVPMAPQNVLIQMSVNTVQFLDEFRSRFERLGFRWSPLDHPGHEQEIAVTFTRVPQCILDKTIHIKSKQHKALSETILTVIKELTSLLHETKGVGTLIPNTILDLINSQACRGAVKFNTELTKKQCCEYLQELAYCKLPFQCAHGRPTTMPLLDLQDNSEMFLEPRPRLERLRSLVITELSD